MKTYVAVVALHSVDGKVQPLFVVWENGVKYSIDRILDVRKATSTKNGGSGIRYECQIQGKTRSLFYDDTIWFIER